METSALLAKLNKLTDGAILERQRFGRSQVMSIWIEARRVAEVGTLLKSEPDFDFDWLENISVAQLERAFVVSYFLRSRGAGGSIVLRCSIDAPQEKDAEVKLDSVVPIWEAAEPYEAEIFDLFGIRFDGRPDARPIMMSGLSGDKGFGGFPLRKDYAGKFFPRENQ